MNVTWISLCLEKEQEGGELYGRNMKNWGTWKEYPWFLCRWNYIYQNGASPFWEDGSESGAGWNHIIYDKREVPEEELLLARRYPPGYHMRELPPVVDEIIYGRVDEIWNTPTLSLGEFYIGDTECNIWRKICIDFSKTKRMRSMSQCSKDMLQFKNSINETGLLKWGRHEKWKFIQESFRGMSGADGTILGWERRSHREAVVPYPIYLAEM